MACRPQALHFLKALTVSSGSAEVNGPRSFKAADSVRRCLLRGVVGRSDGALEPQPPPPRCTSPCSTWTPRVRYDEPIALVLNILNRGGESKS